MSDREGHSGAPPGDDDLSLPKATVAKMIAGVHYQPYSSLVHVLPILIDLQNFYLVTLSAQEKLATL